MCAQAIRLALIQTKLIINIISIAKISNFLFPIPKPGHPQAKDTTQLHRPHIVKGKTCDSIKMEDSRCSTRNCTDREWDERIWTSCSVLLKSWLFELFLPEWRLWSHQGELMMGKTKHGHQFCHVVLNQMHVQSSTKNIFEQEVNIYEFIVYDSLAINRKRQVASQKKLNLLYIVTEIWILWVV
jgi:hypothetical protein